MNIAFYLNELNFRGVCSSTFKYAYYNKKILKNLSYIFYNKKNNNNKKEVLKKFERYFKTVGVNSFIEIDNYEKSFGLDYIYVQKSGQKDDEVSNKIKTLVHAVYPQFLSEVHGFRYAYVSEWLSKKFSNNKIDFVPLIVELKKNKKNLRKKLNLKKNSIIFGCHGGESSFDLNFVKETILEIVNKRKDIYFLFLNIQKFVNHNRIIFLKPTSNENYIRAFINTCDAMIYGRSLGESFGIACAEFSILNKKIISYKYNRHRNHLYSLSNKNIIEYSSKNNLYKILQTFKINKNKKIKSFNKFKDYNNIQTMKIFKKIFLNKKTIKKKKNLFDFLYNYFNLLLILYYYVRHKLYTNYYNIFISKHLD